MGALEAGIKKLSQLYSISYIFSHLSPRRNNGTASKVLFPVVALDGGSLRAAGSTTLFSGAMMKKTV